MKAFIVNVELVCWRTTVKNNEFYTGLYSSNFFVVSVFFKDKKAQIKHVITNIFFSVNII
jgi:hypothetical protein